eukprot:s3291_g3.t1
MARRSGIALLILAALCVAPTFVAPNRSQSAPVEVDTARVAAIAAGLTPLALEQPASAYDSVVAMLQSHLEAGLQLGIRIWIAVNHLTGGRHRIGPDLRRRFRGRLGQSIDQATTGGEGRGGCHQEGLGMGTQYGLVAVRAEGWSAQSQTGHDNADASRLQPLFHKLSTPMFQRGKERKAESSSAMSGMRQGS